MRSSGVTYLVQQSPLALTRALCRNEQDVVDRLARLTPPSVQHWSDSPEQDPEGGESNASANLLYNTARRLLVRFVDSFGDQFGADLCSRTGRGTWSHRPLLLSSRPPRQYHQLVRTAPPSLHLPSRAMPPRHLPDRRRSLARAVGARSCMG